MGFLQGKNALIVGIASNRSIASGVAEAFHREGANLALTYKNDKLKGRVEKIAKQCETEIIFPLDVSSDEQIENLFVNLQKRWDKVDIIVHAVAYAPAEQLEGNYLNDVTREGFHVAHDISSYSFVALAKAAQPMLSKGASLITMSYLGAQRAVPHYNVMGLAKASLEANVRYMAASMGPDQVRVNAISAGPIKTPAAKGISDFNKLLDYGEKNSPLRRNVTIEEVGNATAFLASDLSSGISGEIIYVDGGFHIQTMALPDE
ncbi:MAG: enoyl-ACP reductase [Gammaproteobacteria bacterium]|nr:enoyl-ACP reductase [Gammaproteobacteria bacterium]